MEITSKILESKIENQISIKIKGSDNNILHYLKYINLVDWISYHCAMLNNVDPAIIPNINELKKSL